MEFVVKDAQKNCAFRYLLAMEPMPERSARENAGLESVTMKDLNKKEIGERT